MNFKNYPGVWMYHYVRPDEENSLLYLNKLSVDDFKRHLDYLMESTRVLQPDEFVCGLEGNGFPAGCSLLTFDDGLSDHYHWVLPELQGRGLKGIFFIPIQPLKEYRLLYTHKIHYLYGTKGYHWLSREFKERLPVQKKSIFTHPNAEQAYPYDNGEIAGFKYGINYLLPKNITESVIDKILAENFDEKQIAEGFYLNLEQLLSMQSAGMTIGLHGFSHRPFSILSDDELSAELKSCVSFFEQHLGMKGDFLLSYPFGDQDSVVEDNIEILKRFDVKYAFFTEKTENQSCHHLSRADCNELSKKIWAGER